MYENHSNTQIQCVYAHACDNTYVPHETKGYTQPHSDQTQFRAFRKLTQ